MLPRWPIRDKLLLCLAMLFLIVAILSISGIRSVSSYRQLVRSVSHRAAELPHADEFVRSVDELRFTFSRVRPNRDIGDHPTYDGVDLREDFRFHSIRVNEALRRYREQLEQVEPDGFGIGDNRDERETVRKIQRTVVRIDQLNQEEDWVLDQVQVEMLGEELKELYQLAGELPGHLQQRMQDLKGNVRGQYHALIALTWTTSVLSLVMFLVLIKLFCDWVVRPLQVLIRGSRRVAGGEFDHRIQLHTRDEMAELAAAMNDMTARFQEIRDDLDRQVKERTKEVVRSERLAGVGFLAAGVAHEINNPLAAIAWCADSLESRLHDIIYADDLKPDDEHNEEITVLRKYLRRIQDEAFRCKGITEGLLDFSRMGDVERHDVDLRELTQDVIEMVKHLGRYRSKRIELACDETVLARVNAQEMKQVVLNLITNALDSLETGGLVEVRLCTCGDRADLMVRDNGSGMTEEVLEHLFEPFFTRRRDGQGTGLGLAITYRIVVDHGGKIEASSDGPGCGSQFRVTLPLVHGEGKNEKQQKAA